jgi:hypothetical protein
MDVITRLWDQFWAFFHEGLPHLNYVQAIVIAILGGLMASSIGSVFVIALLAVVIHVLADAVIPMVMHGAAFQLPPLDNAFWHYALTLYVAYLIVIFAIFAIKSVFAAVRG